MLLQVLIGRFIQLYVRVFWYQWLLLSFMDMRCFEIQNKMSTKGGFLVTRYHVSRIYPLPLKYLQSQVAIAYNLPVFFFICLITRGLRFFSLILYIFFGKIWSLYWKRGRYGLSNRHIILILAVVLFIIFT